MNEEKNIIVLQGLEGNEPAHLSGLQVPLAPHVDTLIVGWWIVLVLTTLVVLYKAVQSVRTQMH